MPSVCGRPMMRSLSAGIDSPAATNRSIAAWPATATRSYCNTRSEALSGLSLSPWPRNACVADEPVMKSVLAAAPCG